MFRISAHRVDEASHGLFLGSEAVAHPGLGANPARAVRISFELAAQAAHVHAERVVRDARRRAPHGREQLPVCPHGPGLGEKDVQQRELGRSEVPGLASPPNGSRLPVDLDVAPARKGRRVGAALGTPEEGAGSSHKLGDAERLGDVVVGARIEEADLFALFLRTVRTRIGTGDVVRIFRTSSSPSMRGMLRSVDAQPFAGRGLKAPNVTLRFDVLDQASPRRSSLRSSISSPSCSSRALSRRFLTRGNISPSSSLT